MENKFRNIIKVYKSLTGLHVSLLGEDGRILSGNYFSFKKGASPVAQAHEFGRDFAEKAIKAHKIKQISFLRGKSLYHGRVKAFAEGLRKGGLEF